MELKPITNLTEYNYDNAIQTLGELVLLDFFCNVDPEESFEDLTPIYQQVSEDFDIVIDEVVYQATTRARQIFIAMKEHSENEKESIIQYVEYIRHKYYESNDDVSLH